jgi:hypothetical protein
MKKYTFILHIQPAVSPLLERQCGGRASPYLLSLGTSSAYVRYAAAVPASMGAQPATNPTGDPM